MTAPVLPVTCVCVVCGREVARKHSTQIYCGRKCLRATRPPATPEYRSWTHMRERCLSPRSADYYRYGGRGISICQRWLDSFDAFIADMGPRPSLAHSLDRINNEGDYEPGNCRWATHKEQGSNRSDTWRFVDLDGGYLSLRDLSRSLALNIGVLRRGLIFAGVVDQTHNIYPKKRRAA
jgi:hypothetical protein